MIRTRSRKVAPKPAPELHAGAGSRKILATTKADVIIQNNSFALFTLNNGSTFIIGDTAIITNTKGTPIGVSASYREVRFVTSSEDFTEFSTERATDGFPVTRENTKCDILKDADSPACMCDCGADSMSVEASFDGAERCNAARPGHRAGLNLGSKSVQSCFQLDWALTNFNRCPWCSYDSGGFDCYEFCEMRYVDDGYYDWRTVPHLGFCGSQNDCFDDVKICSSSDFCDENEHGNCRTNGCFEQRSFR